MSILRHISQFRYMLHLVSTMNKKIFPKCNERAVFVMVMLCVFFWMYKPVKYFSYEFCPLIFFNVMVTMFATYFNIK
jgi:hypothetical protein